MFVFFSAKNIDLLRNDEGKPIACLNFKDAFDHAMAIKDDLVAVQHIPKQFIPTNISERFEIYGKTNPSQINNLENPE